MRSARELSRLECVPPPLGRGAHAGRAEAFLMLDSENRRRRVFSQGVGGGEGWVIDLVRGSGVRGCAWRGHLAGRLHKNGSLNAADKNEKFET